VQLDPASKEMVFFEVIHVFLQLRCRGLLGKKRASLHLEKPVSGVITFKN
jgi:hypothetical protein